MGKVNVLLVEDESIVAKDIQLSLKRLGYNVLGIENTGEKAISSARKLDPDIIIMDIMLKGKINGIEASEKIRKRAEHSNNLFNSLC